MILYEKKFRLGDGISFSHYIKSLDEMNFYPYTLLISEIPDTKDFRIEIENTNPLIQFWGWHNAFFGGILFNECTIKYSKDEKFFTLQGSIGIGNFLLALFYIAISLFLFLITLFSMPSEGTSSSGSFFIIAILNMILFLLMTSTYIREKKFLDRIGSIGSELIKK